MTPLDTTIFVGNALAAFTAAVAHGWAALHVLPRRDKIMHQGIALLALLYTAGFTVVAAGWVSILAWSAFFRGVSLFVAWPLVWIMPAVAAGRAWNTAAEGATEIVRRAQELGVGDEPARGRPRASDG